MMHRLLYAKIHAKIQIKYENLSQHRLHANIQILYAASHSADSGGMLALMDFGHIW